MAKWKTVKTYHSKGKQLGAKGGRYDLKFVKTKKGKWASGRKESGELSRWGYHIPDNAYSYKTEGAYSSEVKARDAIKKAWKISRLPKGFELWRA